MPKGIPLLEKGVGREVLKKHCRTAGVPVHVIDSLVDEELRQQGKKSRQGINDNFDHILQDVLQDEGDGDAAPLSRTA